MAYAYADFFAYGYYYFWETVNTFTEWPNLLFQRRITTFCQVYQNGVWDGGTYIVTDYGDNLPKESIRSASGSLVGDRSNPIYGIKLAIANYRVQLLVNGDEFVTTNGVLDTGILEDKITSISVKVFDSSGRQIGDGFTQVHLATVAGGVTRYDSGKTVAASGEITGIQIWIDSDLPRTTGGGVTYDEWPNWDRDFCPECGTMLDMDGRCHNVNCSLSGLRVDDDQYDPENPDENNNPLCRNGHTMAYNFITHSWQCVVDGCEDNPNYNGDSPNPGE